MKNFIFLSLIVLGTLTAKAQSQTDLYVEKYKEAAMQTMEQHGIPASIVLGVAIHESATGTSRIAKYLNNHFGMKGNKGPKPIRSAYNGYESVDESYEDFAGFLKRRFGRLFDRYSSTDYKSWALGIQRGGYAHSKTWASQVMAIIKKHRLYQYDKPAN